MKIRVIDKQTGQTGTLPEENFDPVKYTKIGDASVVAQKPTTLGNIPQAGPSDVLAQAAVAKEKADKRSATEKKIFQAAVVPAAQIIGGMTGGVVGAGLGGAAGEALRQWQGEEKANVGKVLKEGVIGAGTQYLGGKVGELLTKGKAAGKVAEEGTEAITKKPNIVEKAGTYVKKKASGIKSTAKIKVTDPTRAIKAANVDDIIDSYNLYGADASSKVSQFYKTAIDDLADAAASSTEKIDPTDVLTTLKQKVLMEVPELTKSEKAVQTLLENQIKAAKTVADLNAIDIGLRGTINKMTGSISSKKLLYKTVQDTIRETISSKLPQYEQSYKVLADMRTVAPAVHVTEDALVNGSLINIGRGGIKLEAPAIVRNLGVKVGTNIEKLGAGLPNISTSGLGLPPIVGQAVAPAMQIGAAAMQQPPEVQATGGLGAIPQNEGAAVSGITDITTPSIEGAATKTYVTGFSPEQLYQGYMKALSEGNKSAASQLKTMYSDEVAYQKTQGKAGGKAIPSTQVTELADMKYSINSLKKMKDEIASGKGIFGPLLGRARGLNPYDPEAQIFQSQIMALAQNVGRAMEGGVLRQEDVKKYLRILPKISDTRASAAGKIADVMKSMEAKLKERQLELELSGYTQEGTTTTELPSTSEEY